MGWSGGDHPISLSFKERDKNAERGGRGGGVKPICRACHFYFASLLHSYWPAWGIGGGFDAAFPGQFPRCQHAKRDLALRARHAQLADGPPEGPDSHQRWALNAEKGLLGGISPIWHNWKILPKSKEGNVSPRVWTSTRMFNLCISTEDLRSNILCSVWLRMEWSILDRQPENRPACVPRMIGKIWSSLRERLFWALLRQ